MESLVVRIQCTNESEENFRAMRVCYDAFVNYLRRKQIVFACEFVSRKQSWAEIVTEEIPQEVYGILKNSDGVIRVIDRTDNGMRYHSFVKVDVVDESDLPASAPEVCTISLWSADGGAAGRYSKNRLNDKYHPLETFTGGDFDTFWAE
jgi:hypothetical protein